ncbi:two-component system OmpR family response regulator/two-component system phosphate regulon response regulator OmpR [Sulfuritortus calidifontis]|uniref:Two-component system OmpR family response regulator/two-component system phosphate regulon response regulator OmpR n=1 Tax=Sulfuritortus calidifontis TaxID=1914471 RepID=A0A4R3JY97_9PROT|nr:response regulator [Sulfuritortus calidifontis]TCS72606.1 two-component system OmpR family response regulator/two-component system phosphate regulon response regulator OmpR [Sulfuritortus calidifontis]
MENPTPILIVDDDAGIRDLLADYLAQQGYAVATAGDGRQMTERLQQRLPALVVMDLMLPGEDGLSLTRQLKAAHGLPVIMLSARGEDIDRIVGLEVGADDYLPKPFNPRELLARIRAVLRRGEAQTDKAPPEQAEFGPFRLDLAAQRLSRDGAEIPLTQAEFTLLKIFVEHPNRALSRDQIVDWLKGFERDPFDRSIDVRVTRLRKKIEDDPANPVYIRTVWGQGYLFSPKGKG